MKLIGSFVLIAVIMFGMNILTYINANQMLSRVEEVYSENVSLNNMILELAAMQNAMTEYLNTKSSDSMEDYFRCEQKLKESLEHLNIKITDQTMYLMEKNIYYMSQTYLNLTSETIQSKRGRLIEKYSITYQKASEIYDYLNTYLYSLNNEQFINNTANYNNLLGSFRTFELATTIILASDCVIMILIIIQLTRRITYPLSHLAKAANEVSSGNLLVELPRVTSKDEVGVMANAFNQMICSLRTYIVQIRENMELESKMKEKELMMEAHLKDAKLKYLQAQIQPHFLFNTLYAGAQLAMMEDADRTYEYIQNVASFYRYNICQSEESSTLEEEVKLIDNYIYILNVRYSGDIIFEKEIDSTVLDTHIPRMVLQPIVENAVKYGIQEVDYQGRIRLYIRGIEDSVLVVVEDNGAGMSNEQIQKILGKDELSTDCKNSSNGVGLVNVKNRLNLFFDQDDVLQIESEGKNQGTKVSLLIPKQGECND